MSTIQDKVRPADLDAQLANRIRTERQNRKWTVQRMSEESGVSRAMISKIERGEASPTASLLSRIAGAFGLTLSMLLARAEGDVGSGGRLLRAGQQPLWRDPGSFYVRRAVSPAGSDPELALMEVPPEARVAFPATSFVSIKGLCIWIIEGVLHFRQGSAAYELEVGDCLVLGPAADCEYYNPGPSVGRYLVTLRRR